MKTSELVAVGKAINAKVLKEAGQNLDSGRYEVDLLIRVFGAFNKGEAFEQKLPNKINWQLAFALALSKVNNETRFKIMNNVLEVFGKGEESEEYKKLTKQVKDEIQPKLDELKGITTTQMSGKITTELSTEVMGGGKVKRLA